MEIPLTVWDIGVWLSLNAILLLTTSEIINSYSEKQFSINKDNLKIISIVLGILFFITAVINRFILYNNSQS